MNEYFHGRVRSARTATVQAAPQYRLIDVVLRR
jgi:hypothetical protein